SAGCCATYIIADDQYVYWSAWYTIYRAPVSGGAPQHLYDGYAIRTLVLDGGNLYWTTGGCCSSGSGSVRVGPAGGGSQTLLAPGSPNGGVAVDAQHV